MNHVYIVSCTSLLGYAFVARDRQKPLITADISSVYILELHMCWTDFECSSNIGSESISKQQPDRPNAYVGGTKNA